MTRPANHMRRAAALAALLLLAGCGNGPFVTADPVRICVELGRRVPQLRCRLPKAIASRWRYFDHGGTIPSMQGIVDDGAAARTPGIVYRSR